MLSTAQLYARFDSTSGEGVTNYYNALGLLTATVANMDSVSRTLNYQADVAGNLYSLMHPDGNSVNYFRHAGSGELYYAALNGTSPLFYPPRDAAGRVSVLYRLKISDWNWVDSTGFSYDALSRPSALSHNVAGTSYDTTTSFTYNPASQIASIARDNDTYAWPGAAAIDRGYAANGLNQYSTITPAGGSAVSQSYDANGNLTSDGTQTFTYDIENRLVARSGGGTTAALRYDPLGRLYEVTGSATGTTRFLYDGSDLVAEYNTSGTLLRRYVHGGGAGDDPLVWFEGSGVGDSARLYLYADERGSIVAVTDSNGANVTVNSYDEYGIPASGNAGRFGYTGQAWLPELGMWYYKARMYSPTLGRFMQTDPIGYGDGMNMYAYVGGDPVNAVDPTGLDWVRNCVTQLPTDPQGNITGPGVPSCGWGWDGQIPWQVLCFFSPGSCFFGVPGSGGDAPPGGGGGNGGGDPAPEPEAIRCPTGMIHINAGCMRLVDPKPAYCFRTSYKFGSTLVDIGTFGQRTGAFMIVTGGAAAALGSWSGFGTAPGAAWATMGGGVYNASTFLAVAGHGFHLFAGDKNALGPLIMAPVGGLMLRGSGIGSGGQDLVDRATSEIVPQLGSRC